MSVTLAVLESLMLVAGEFSLDAIAAVAPNARLDLFEKQSDYGRRVRDQLPRVVELLRADPDSRKALLTFNRQDVPFDDITCITSAQFLVRDGSLKTYITQRSWDLGRGMPNDLIMYGILAMVVGRALGLAVEKGSIQVTCPSLHVYVGEEERATADRDLFLQINPDLRWGSTWGFYADWAAHSWRQMARSLKQDFIFYEVLP